MTTLPGDASTLNDFGEENTPEPGTAAAKAIEGRSLTQIGWARLKKDKVAMGAGILVLILVVIAILAPLLASITGAGDPTVQYADNLNPDTSMPMGAMGGIDSHHWLGIEPVNARDVFSRVLYGSRVSLLIATLASLLSLLIGITMGVVAGYFGGWIDAAISRVMDVFLAFPLLLFALALAAITPDTFFGMSGDTLRIAMLVFIIGFFGWPYAGRIVRGQTIALREREFVDAARVLGAKPRRIILRELMPNLVAPILVYATLLIPANILFEAALSFLGVGIRNPTPSWGKMLNDAINYYRVDPTFLIIPGAAIFVTVLAFNLFGDGLRDAFDPKAH
ncbi:ABC transporter permease [Catenulispora subtropica]|uniref:ABC transporter permease n=1 Tax=Catenulispora subtropica TaxID=450798 RepID=A0ABP5ERG7_9ACTN